MGVERMNNLVYWFSSHITELEVLENIYTLLFLHIIGYWFVRFIYIIKNVKW